MTLPTTNLFSHLVADDLSLADGDPVSTWTKTAGSYATSPTASGSGRPTYRANRLSGKAVLEFDGVDDFMTWGSVGDFNFLHDGTGCDVFVVACPIGTVVRPDRRDVVLDTCNLSSASTGFAVSFDDRVSASRLRACDFFIAKSSSGNPVVSSATNFAFPHNTWSVIRAAYKNQTGNDAFQWTNNTERVAAAQLQTPVSSNHSFAMRIGRRASTSTPEHYARMYIAEIIIYDDILSSTDRDDVHAYLNEKYAPGLLYASNAPVEAKTTIINDADWNGVVHIPQKLANDNLIAVWRRASSSDRHDGYGTIEQSISTDEGATWGTPTEISRNGIPSTGQDSRDPGILVTESGDVLVSYHERTQNVGLSGICRCRKSTDGGFTYGSGVTITTSFTAFAKMAAPLVELANGDLLAPIYGQDTGDSFWSVRISKSTDGGATWSHLAEVADGQANSVDYIEPNLVIDGNGDLICMIRQNTNVFIMTSRSTDGGVTWSTPVFTFVGNGAPRVNLFQSTAGFPILLSMFRISNPSPPRFRVSTDNGYTWSEDVLLDGPSPQMYYYGGFYGHSNGFIYAGWSQNDDVTNDLDVNVFFRKMDVLNLDHSGDSPAEGFGNINAVGTLTGTGQSVRSGAGGINAVGEFAGVGVTPAVGEQAGFGNIDAIGNLVGVGLSPTLGESSGFGSINGVAAIAGVGSVMRSGSGNVNAIGTLAGAGNPRLNSTLFRYYYLMR